MGEGEGEGEGGDVTTSRHRVHRRVCSSVIDGQKCSFVRDFINIHSRVLH